MFIASSASLVACLIAIGWVVWRTGANYATDLGLTLAHIQADLRLGGAAFVMMGPVVYAIQMILVSWFPSRHPLTTMFLENPSWSIFLLAGFAAVVVAPLVEEFLFRVLLQGWLDRLARQLTPAWRENALSGKSTPTPEAGQANRAGKAIAREVKGVVGAEQGADSAVEEEDRQGRRYPAAGPASEPVCGERAIAADAVAEHLFPPKLTAENAADGTRSVRPMAIGGTSGIESQVRVDGREESSDLHGEGLVTQSACWQLIVTSLIFAALHSTHGPDPIPLIVF